MNSNFLKSILFSFIFISNNLNAVKTDDYIQQFVKRENNEKVAYKNGKLILLADPSYFAESILGMLSAGIVVCGGTLFIAGTKGKTTDAGLSLMGALIVGVGGYMGSLLVERWRKILLGVPLLILDEKGIFLNEKRVCYWKDIQTIEVEKQTVYEDGFARKSTRHVDFFDKYKNSLFAMPEENMLPISFNNFLALVEYYHKTYKV